MSWQIYTPIKWLWGLAPNWNSVNGTPYLCTFWGSLKLNTIVLPWNWCGWVMHFQRHCEVEEWPLYLCEILNFLFHQSLWSLKIILCSLYHWALGKVQKGSSHKPNHFLINKDYSNKVSVCNECSWYFDRDLIRELYLLYNGKGKNCVCLLPSRGASGSHADHSWTKKKGVQHAM